jgi:hypothetical protein
MSNVDCDRERDDHPPSATCEEVVEGVLMEEVNLAKFDDGMAFFEGQVPRIARHICECLRSCQLIIK